MELNPDDAFGDGNSSISVAWTVAWSVWLILTRFFIVGGNSPSDPAEFRTEIQSLIPICRYLSKVKVAQSCLILCDPMDYIVHGILQARILGWLFPSPGDHPKPGFEPRSPALQMDSLPAEPQGKPGDV